MKKIIITIVSILIIGGVWYSFDKKTETKNNEPIKIGFIGPLTGENAVIGEGIKNAISLASSNENVKVIYEDDQFNEKLGVTAYHKLVDIDKVNAIINTTPSVADAIKPLVKENKIIVIQIAEPGLSDDDSIFQIMPSGASLYSELGKIVKNKYQSFAFVYQGGATFEKAKNSFREAYEDSEHSFREYHIDNNKDYRTVIAKMKSDTVEAYTIIATPSVGSQFIKQVKEQKLVSNLVCNADMEVTVNEYLKILSKETFNDCISTMFADRMSNDFKTNYEKTFGSKPGFATDYGFDAIKIITKTHDLDFKNWVSNLKDLNFIGVSGAVKFNEVGVRIPEIETHFFKDGAFSKLK